MAEYVETGADISTDEKYRYRLWREWRGTASPQNWRWLGVKDSAGTELGTPKSCLFIMLNPSTADADKDDPTIRRCVTFAKRFEFDRLEVVNLFAFRATHPRDILRMSASGDPIGPRNQEVIGRAAADAGLIICAWGAHGSHIRQDETVLGWLEDRVTYVLGRSKNGHPRHPLYLRTASQLLPMDSINGR